MRSRYRVSPSIRKPPPMESERLPGPTARVLYWTATSELRVPLPARISRPLVAAGGCACAVVSSASKQNRPVGRRKGRATYEWKASAPLWSGQAKACPTHDGHGLGGACFSLPSFFASGPSAVRELLFVWRPDDPRP